MARRIAGVSQAEWEAEARHLGDTNWSGGGPSPGHDLFKTMIRHRELFRAWNDFGRTIFKGELPPRDRELLILRSAWLTQCRFEWAYHQPVAERLGLTGSDITRILKGPDAPGWTESDAVLLRAVDELHQDARISDATWDLLAGTYNERQLIEIPLLVGEYQMVAYFANSLGVEPDATLPEIPQAI